MRSEQIRWSQKNGWVGYDKVQGAARNLVLVFFDNHACLNPQWYETLKEMYPNAVIAGASSSGSVLDTIISDEDAVATAITFDRTQVRSASKRVIDFQDMEQLGIALGKELHGETLRHVFILSDGLTVNGSELARGLSEVLPDGVSITGGMAGDGTRFGATYVMAQGVAEIGVVAAIGLYGESLIA
jgi:hypothetical protein